MTSQRIRRHLRFLASLRVRAMAAAALTAALLSPAAAQQRDAKAVELGKSVMQAMGGEKAWDNVHFVRYDFIVSMGGETRANRSHLWDKWAGRYRFESKTKEGKSQVVLFNVNDQQGDVYIDGARIDGEGAATALKGAYSAFINDMYWLAMPWKWLDQGVNLKYIGAKEHEGKNYEVVELTFQKVGLTPGDTYNAYIDPSSKLMTHWEYTLQGGNKGAWNWEYGTHNGVKLASNHTNAEGASINMGTVAVFEKVEDAFFTDPARGLSQLR
ncbi:MAG: DUF6503 family protein [Bryobacterales bacterium]